LLIFVTLAAMTAEIRFYHVESDTAVKALPALVNKALSKGMRVLLKAPDPARRAFYDDYLWRYDRESFLPHGQDGDPMADQQPVWVSTEDAAPNGARMALLVEGAAMPPLGDYDLVCSLFDSENEEALQQARQQWSALKKQDGLMLTYWKKETNGQWAKQNI
jgi:DNA polymerase-3 subunit chi